MAKILVVSDTHSDDGLPANLCLMRLIEGLKYDYIIHLGDIISRKVLEQLSQFANRLIAVSGEADKLTLPDKELMDIEGLRILMLHGHQKEIRGSRLRSIADELRARVILMGHSHKAGVVDLGGIVMANPGTLTGYGNMPQTWIEMEVNAGEALIQLKGCGGVLSTYRYGGYIRRAIDLLELE